MFRLRLAVVTAALCSLCLSAGLSGCNRDPNVRKQKYLESGKRYEAEGKLREAVIQFSNALKVDKGFAAAHYELGKTYTKMKLPMQAYAELSKTVDLDPKNIQARISQDAGPLRFEDISCSARPELLLSMRTPHLHPDLFAPASMPIITPEIRQRGIFRMAIRHADNNSALLWQLK